MASRGATTTGLAGPLIRLVLIATVPLCDVTDTHSASLPDPRCCVCPDGREVTTTIFTCSTVCQCDNCFPGERQGECRLAPSGQVLLYKNGSCNGAHERTAVSSIPYLDTGLLSAYVYAGTATVFAGAGYNGPSRIGPKGTCLSTGWDIRSVSINN